METGTTIENNTNHVAQLEGNGGEDEKMELDVDGREGGVQVKESGGNEVNDLDGEDEMEDDDEGEDEDDDDEEDELDDEDAEAIARRLGDQLWADIQRARAGTTAAPATNAASTADEPNALTNDEESTPAKNTKEEAALATMRAVLACSEQDAPVRARLATTLLPPAATDSSSAAEANSPSSPPPIPDEPPSDPASIDESPPTNTLLALLMSCVGASHIPSELAARLSHALLAIAKAEDLFTPHALGLSVTKRDVGDDATATQATDAGVVVVGIGMLGVGVPDLEAAVGTKRKASGEVHVEGAKRLATESPGISSPTPVEVMP